MAEISNWAGNVTFSATQVRRPTTVPALQALVAGAERVRALGAGHSFNRIADTAGELVSVAGMPPQLDIDRSRSVVRVSAGLRYADVAAHLDRAGFALANLGSLPHISVAGACATGTHGSGNDLGNLATSVTALDLVLADGSVATLAADSDRDRFRGAVIGLGALGIVTALELLIQPSFAVQQVVYRELAPDQLLSHLAEIFGADYSVSVFTDWAEPRTNRVWRKHRVDTDRWSPPDRWFGATRADRPEHPVAEMPSRYCTDQSGEPGPWHTRLPHFRPESVPSRGDELQSEYMIARDRLTDALQALEPIAPSIARMLHISEIRTIAADDLWLSPTYGRDSAAIHFTWHRRPDAVLPVVAEIEARLRPYDARPHWGKVFQTPGRYERLDDFRALARDLDPDGKFGNEFLDTVIGPT